MSKFEKSVSSTSKINQASKTPDQKVATSIPKNNDEQGKSLKSELDQVYTQHRQLIKELKDIPVAEIVKVIGQETLVAILDFTNMLSQERSDLYENLDRDLLSDIQDKNHFVTEQLVILKKAGLGHEVKVPTKTAGSKIKTPRSVQFSSGFSSSADVKKDGNDNKTKQESTVVASANAVASEQTTAPATDGGEKSETDLIIRSKAKSESRFVYDMNYTFKADPKYQSFERSKSLQLLLTIYPNDLESDFNILPTGLLQSKNSGELLEPFRALPSLLASGQTKEAWLRTIKKEYAEANPRVWEILKKQRDINALKTATNIYEFFDVPPTTDPELIKVRYRQAVKRWHSDRPGGDDTVLAGINALYTKFEARKAPNDDYAERVKKKKNNAKTTEQNTGPSVAGAIPRESGQGVEPPAPTEPEAVEAPSNDGFGLYIENPWVSIDKEKKHKMTIVNFDGSFALANIADDKLAEKKVEDEKFKYKRTRSYTDIKEYPGFFAARDHGGRFVTLDAYSGKENPARFEKILKMDQMFIGKRSGHLQLINPDNGKASFLDFKDLRQETYKVNNNDTKVVIAKDIYGKELVIDAKSGEALSKRYSKIRVKNNKIQGRSAWYNDYEDIDVTVTKK
jgi:hypothetical protein